MHRPSYPVLRSYAKKGLAACLSLCLLWTSGNIVEAALAIPQAFATPALPPQFELVPPPSLGRIADYFNASPKSNVQSPKSNPQSDPPDFGPWTGDLGLVVLIQDLHAHYGVQKNIAQLLEFLSEKLRSGLLAGGSDIKALGPRSPEPRASVPFTVAVEGAEGPIDSSVMALFPDQKIKQEALDYLMREGELTGMEYFAAMRGIPNLLYGVEDWQYYDLHRELFRKTLSDRQELVGLLKALQADIAPLRERLYSSTLKAFQKSLDAFDQGEISNEEMAGVLEEKAVASGINLKADFPDLHHYLLLMGSDPPATPLGGRAPVVWRSGLTPRSSSGLPTVEQLRQYTADFLKETQNVLSNEERQTLARLGKARSGFGVPGSGVSAHSPEPTAFFLYLRELIHTHQLYLAAPLELGRYLEYLYTSQTIGMDRITHDMQELAFRIKLKTAQGSGLGAPKSIESSEPTAQSPERTRSASADLVQVEHDLSLLVRIADVQATEMEVRDFGPRLNQFVALADSLLSSSRQSASRDPGTLTSTSLGPGLRPAGAIDAQRIRQLISASIDYYALALMRNKPMVDNTLRLLRAPGSGLRNQQGRQSPQPKAQSVVVLVAGGFHTEPIVELLREKNVSYIVITPTVDQITDSDHELYVKRLSGQLLTDQEVRDAAFHIRSESKWAGWFKASQKIPSPLRGEGGGEGDSSNSDKGLALGLFGLYLAPHLLDFAAGRWMILHHADWGAAVAAVAALVLPKLVNQARILVQNWQKKNSKDSASVVAGDTGNLTQTAPTHAELGQGTALNRQFNSDAGQSSEFESFRGFENLLKAKVLDNIKDENLPILTDQDWKTLEIKLPPDELENLYQGHLSRLPPPKITAANLYIPPRLKKLKLHQPDMIQLKPSRNIPSTVSQWVNSLQNLKIPKNLFQTGFDGISKIIPNFVKSGFLRSFSQKRRSIETYAKRKPSGAWGFMFSAVGWGTVLLIMALFSGLTMLDATIAAIPAAGGTVLNWAISSLYNRGRNPENHQPLPLWSRIAIGLASAAASLAIVITGEYLTVASVAIAAIPFAIASLVYFTFARVYNNRLERIERGEGLLDSGGFGDSNAEWRVALKLQSILDPKETERYEIQIYDDVRELNENQFVQLEVAQENPMYMKVFRTYGFFFDQKTRTLYVNNRSLTPGALTSQRGVRVKHKNVGLAFAMIGTDGEVNVYAHKNLARASDAMLDRILKNIIGGVHFYQSGFPALFGRLAPRMAQLAGNLYETILSFAPSSISWLLDESYFTLSQTKGLVTGLLGKIHVYRQPHEEIFMHAGNRTIAMHNWLALIYRIIQIFNPPAAITDDVNIIEILAGNHFGFGLFKAYLVDWAIKALGFFKTPGNTNVPSLPRLARSNAIVGAMHDGEDLYQVIKQRFGKVLTRLGWDRVMTLLEEHHGMVPVANLETNASDGPEENGSNPHETPHVGFGIRMKGEAQTTAQVINTRKGALLAQVGRGELPAGYHRETIRMNGSTWDVVVHPDVLKRVESQGITLNEFIENTVKIRGPKYTPRLIQNLNGKRLVIDALEASPNLYGNCQNDGYVYINLRAPVVMDLVGISHEWMHEAGLFSGSERDEQTLAIQDRTLMVQLGLSSESLQLTLGDYAARTSPLLSRKKIDAKLFCGDRDELERTLGSFLSETGWSSLHIATFIDDIEKMLSDPDWGTQNLAGVKSQVWQILMDVGEARDLRDYERLKQLDLRLSRVKNFEQELIAPHPIIKHVQDSTYKCLVALDHRARISSFLALLCPILDAQPRSELYNDILPHYIARQILSHNPVAFLNLLTGYKQDPEITDAQGLMVALPPTLRRETAKAVLARLNAGEYLERLLNWEMFSQFYFTVIYSFDDRVGLLTNPMAFRRMYTKLLSKHFEGFAGEMDYYSGLSPEDAAAQFDLPEGENVEEALATYQTMALQTGVDQLVEFFNYNPGPEMLEQVIDLFRQDPGEQPVHLSPAEANTLIWLVRHIPKRDGFTRDRRRQVHRYLIAMWEDTLLDPFGPSTRQFMGQVVSAIDIPRMNPAGVTAVLNFMLQFTNLSHSLRQTVSRELDLKLMAWQEAASNKKAFLGPEQFVEMTETVNQILIDHLISHALTLTPEDSQKLRVHVMQHPEAWNRHDFLRLLASYHSFQKDEGKKYTEDFLRQLLASKVEGDRFTALPRYAWSPGMRRWMGENLEKRWRSRTTVEVPLQEFRQSSAIRFEGVIQDIQEHLGIQPSGQITGLEQRIQAWMVSPENADIPQAERDTLAATVSDILTTLAADQPIAPDQIRQWRTQLLPEGELPYWYRNREAWREILVNLDQILPIQAFDLTQVSRISFEVTDDPVDFALSGSEPYQTCQRINEPTGQNNNGRPINRLRQGQFLLARLVAHKKDGSSTVLARTHLELAQGLRPGHKDSLLAQAVPMRVLLVERIYQQGLLPLRTIYTQILKWATRGSIFDYAIFAQSNGEAKRQLFLQFIPSDGPIYRDTFYEGVWNATDLKAIARGEKSLDMTAQDLNRTGNATVVPQSPFSLRHHLIAWFGLVVGSAITVAFVIPWLLQIMGINPALNQLYLNGLAGFIAALWGLPIGLSGGLGWLTKKLAPKNPRRDLKILKDLNSQVARAHPGAEVNETEEPAQFGWLASTDWTDPVHPTVRFAPWLVAESSNTLFNFLRGLLLPLVLAHELRRLEHQSTLRIYLSKNLPVLIAGIARRALSSHQANHNFERATVANNQIYGRLPRWLQKMLLRNNIPIETTQPRTEQNVPGTNLVINTPAGTGQTSTPSPAAAKPGSPDSLAWTFMNRFFPGFVMRHPSPAKFIGMALAVVEAFLFVHFMPTLGIFKLAVLLAGWALTEMLLLIGMPSLPRGEPFWDSWFGQYSKKLLFLTPYVASATLFQSHSLLTIPAIALAIAAHLGYDYAQIYGRLPRWLQLFIARAIKKEQPGDSFGGNVERSTFPGETEQRSTDSGIKGVRPYTLDVRVRTSTVKMPAGVPGTTAQPGAVSGQTQMNDQITALGQTPVPSPAVPASPTQNGPSLGTNAATGAEQFVVAPQEHARIAPSEEEMKRIAVNNHKEPFQPEESGASSGVPTPAPVPTAIDRRTIDALATHVQSRVAAPIIEIDLSQRLDTSLVEEAFRSGQPIRLNLGNLRRGEGGYHDASGAFFRITNCAAYVFGQSVPPRRLPPVFNELLFNAFRHGNRLDFDLPIFIRVDPQKRQIEIYDMASNRVISEADKKTLYINGLSGRGQAVRAIQEDWDYERRPILVGDMEKPVGTMVSVTLKKGPDAESEINPQAGREGMPATPASATKGSESGVPDSSVQRLGEESVIPEVRSLSTEESRTPTGTPSLPVAGDRSIDLLRSHIQTRASFPIIDVDLSQPLNTSLIEEALSNGQPLHLSLRNLRSGQLGYRDAKAAFTDISECAALILGQSIPPTRVPFALSELLKNALVHGNRLDFNLPIFILTNTQKRRIEVYDTASTRAISYADRANAHIEGLGGIGMGLSMTKDRWDYERRPILVGDTEKPVGTMASVTLRKGPDAESEIHPPSGTKKSTISSALTLPNTYKAGTILKRAGWRTFLRWVFSRDREALERTERYQKILANPISEAEKIWVQNRVSWWYEYFKTYQLSFVEQHATPYPVLNDDPELRARQFAENKRVQDLRARGWVMMHAASLAGLAAAGNLGMVVLPILNNQFFFDHPVLAAMALATSIVAPNMVRHYLQDASAPLTMGQSSSKFKQVHIGGNGEGGFLDDHFEGDIWITAGEFRFKVWVSGNQVYVQPHLASGKYIAYPSRFALGKSIRVGRDAHLNDVSIPADSLGDSSLLKEHFSIEITKDREGAARFHVEDLRSPNGTTAEWTGSPSASQAEPEAGQKPEEIHEERPSSQRQRVPVGGIGRGSYQAAAPTIDELFQRFNEAMRWQPLNLDAAKAALNAIEDRKAELDQYQLANLRMARDRLSSAKANQRASIEDLFQRFSKEMNGKSPNLKAAEAALNAIENRKAELDQYQSANLEFARRRLNRWRASQQPTIDQLFRRFDEAVGRILPDLWAAEAILAAIRARILELNTNQLTHLRSAIERLNQAKIDSQRERMEAEARRAREQQEEQRRQQQRQRPVPRERQMTLEDAYQELGLDRPALLDLLRAGSIPEFEKAVKGPYRKLALKLHPDRRPDEQEKATKDMQRLNQAFGEVAADLEQEAKRMGKIIRLRNGGARLTLGELLNHFRPGQAARLLAGVLWNLPGYLLKGRNHGDLLKKLKELEGQVNKILEREGKSQSAQFQPVRFEIMEVPWYKLLWRFGSAEEGVIKTNPLLPHKMQAPIHVHELLHLFHPDWTEAQVIAMTDHYMADEKTYQDDLPQAVARSAHAESEASATVEPGDILSIVPRLLTERRVKPREAASISAALQSSRKAILGAA